MRTAVRLNKGDMRIIKENTIGLVIDIQEKLFHVMAEKDEFLKNCSVLVRGLQVLNIPLLVTQQYTKGLGGTVPEIRYLIPEFEFIEKRAFSCCDEPVFVEKASIAKRTNIIICGIESHVCVLQTAVDLKDAGYVPVVVTDCISSRNLKDKEMAIGRFRYEGIMMATCESILFELTRTSEAPEFRGISKLVK